MTGLGDRLKEARTKKGFSLEDLQTLTKIQKRYLSGIENEDYSMMPGSFYVRAFIKQYAEAVDLDANEMLALYKDTTPPVSTDQETSKIASAPMSRRRGIGSSNRLNEMMPKFIVALFIVVIFAVVLFLFINNPSRKAGVDVKREDPNIATVEPTKPPASKSEKEKDEDSEEPVEPEEEEPVVAQSLAFDGAKGETSTYSLSTAETFQLEIRTSDASWIGIKDNTGKEWMEPARIMNAGETITYDVSATDSVRIRVGRPSNTEIYVNGELMEYGVEPKATVPQNIIIEYKKEE